MSHEVVVVLKLEITWDDERDVLNPQWRVTAYDGGNYLDDWDLWDGYGSAAPDDEDADLIKQALLEAEAQLGRKVDSGTVDRRFVPTLEEFVELLEFWANADGRLDDEFCR